MKHSDIRQAIIDALEGTIGHDAIYFDGRPVAFEENEFPVVAVF
ncbi:TPA: phage tail terminator protein, partial [Citrobacter amalonaticus]